MALATAGGHVRTHATARSAAMRRRKKKKRHYAKWPSACKCVPSAIAWAECKAKRKHIKKTLYEPREKRRLRREKRERDCGSNFAIFPLCSFLFCSVLHRPIRNHV
jgi:hypothetical protein